MIDTVRRGRECFGRRRWADAFANLSAADQEASLEPDDLELLATAAYMVGRDNESAEIWIGRDVSRALARVRR